MWRIRESIVGRLNVTAGKFVVLPGRGEKTTDLMARQESPHAMTAEVVLRFRHWSQWYTMRKADYCKVIFFGTFNWAGTIDFGGI
jgi:hypothetical protein